MMPWTVLSIARCLGVMTLLIGLVLRFIFPAELAWTYPGVKTPIIAFEFAQTPTEVFHLFGDGIDLRDALVRAMDWGNYVDFIFMAVYVSFLAVLLWLHKPLLAGLTYWCLGLAVIILATDFIENIALLNLTHLVNVGYTGASKLQGWLHVLIISTWFKWMTIVVVITVLGLACRFIHWSGWLILCLGWVGLLLGGWNILYRDSLELFASVVFLSFIILVFYIFTASTHHQHNSFKAKKRVLTKI
ncbi:hypothetical protein H0A36_25065 [Endozoicomonas sp. SM1973]|uniref:DUF4386 domain-containing protein n=1 Tax=Spartinivicinus marinus TaxID=2994442 RepID=A0A853IGZ5_9GAMM|nr:hypothetical protein [Spartinivicinus marinus]MCX4028057.1 hypothetical protein [Spartinivicinus marinus]NYZ69294.1 hypothetical protein [Spartinivicinus marinus]